MNDPLRTGLLREAALAAWTQHPVRFREDANSEEDHARGYYRDRVVVELAQNAADAASRAGVAGRLLLRLAEADGRQVLVAANTGAPLDAVGVASLASLRASAKRDATAMSVGRFGVGFAAVRSVCDEVSLVSATGAVHFSLDGTRSVLDEVGATVPGLVDEVDRRGAWLPVLRLPFPGAAPGHAAAVPAAGTWDTVVVLTLRDEAAVAQVRAQLAAVDDVLLLALPALTEVTVEAGGAPQVLSEVADRWLVARRGGILDGSLLEDRPVEERDRTGWQVTWAVRRSGHTRPATVHAPTPTDEPCTVPARLIGTFPLDPTRRHVAAGPLTDFLVAEAGRVWSDLLTACRDAADAPDLADLLPGGLPAGPLDAAVRETILATTRHVPVLERAGGGPPVAPADALVLSEPVDPAAVRLLGRRWPALVDVPRHRYLTRLLEIPTIDLSDVVGGLPTLPPADARELYGVFSGADPGTLEQLATLPVPLADGRTVHGPRGLVVLDGDPGEDALAALADWGVRVVHPDAAHPLLERLGAEHLDIAGLLHSPVLRERVLDDDDPSVVEVMLSLVDAALRTGTLDPEPWWGEALLPAADGELVPARGLVLAGSQAQRHLDPAVLPALDPAVQERWGEQVLAALGVRTGLAVLGVPADLADAGDIGESLDGWSTYRRDVGLDVGEGPEDLVVVADLDAVLPAAWPEVLLDLAGRHRRALEPVRLPGPGATGRVPSYTAWWLRHRSPLALGRPFAVGTGGPAWLEPAPEAVAGLDRDVQRWLGGVAAAEDLDAAGWAALLADLDPGDPVDMPFAVGAWRALARLAADPGPLADVDVLPALAASGVRAVVAADVAVASPMWAQHPAARPLLVVPAGAVAAVADGMDLDRADERTPGRVTSAGEPAATPDVVRVVFPSAPATWVEHEDLLVDGSSVQWWVADQVHAATTSGLARGLAEIVGPRHVGRIERLLGDPGAVDQVLLDLAGDS